MRLLELEIQRPKLDKEFPRNIMPQVRKGDLDDSPFEYNKEEVKLDTLKPVQRQRVAGMHDKAKRGFADGTIRPIIVDKDNYIVNGHHRYDIALSQGLPKTTVLKVDATIEDLIDHYSNKADDSPTFEAYIKEKLAKAMEEELEEDWKNVARAGLATAALGMGVAGMDSVTPDDFAPDKPQAVKSVDNDIDRNLAEFEKSSKEFNDLYNKYVQKFTDEAKNSFDRNHIKDKAELQTIKHWLKMFNSRADFTDYLNKTYPDRVKAQQDTNINNTMPNSMPDRVGENFADGKKKGKSKPGRVKKAGASCDGSVTSLRKKAKDSSGEKSKMYHWCANMKSGRKKS
jgi:hypothetical protein